MRLIPLVTSAAFGAALALSSATAQTPRLYLRFDGNTNDTSGAGVITSVTAAGFTPSYTVDRNGVANGALAIGGNGSLKAVAASGLSNQALGLRDANGAPVSFTLSAWIYCTNVGGGYNTVFGNEGTGAGTLHAGLGSNSAKTHFGFDDNDVNGGVTDIQSNNWYHLTFVYDGEGETQRIFINGIPEATRSGAPNTLKAADLLIGNWSTTTNSSNDFRGRLDDVAVYNVALAADQILALAAGVSPAQLPAAATYSGPKTPGFGGTTGVWGVRELRTSPNNTNSINSIPIGTLVNADRIAKSYALNQAGVTLQQYQIPVINFRDSTTNPGSIHSFGSDSEFRTDTTSDDNNLVMVAKCAIRITQEDDYSFAFRGDDGSRLRVIGAQFRDSTKVTGSVNPADPAHHGDGIYWVNGTGDSHTIGITHLVPGDYNVELTYWEGNGGSSIEVSAARGDLTFFDSTFKLIGDPNGGLPIVRDPDTLPQIQSFTANGASPAAYLHAPLPATFNLAWTTNSGNVPGQTVSISNGVGAVAQNGTVAVATPATTTNYVITSTFGADSASKTVMVRINTPPVINSFTSTRTVSITGQPLDLAWDVDGAASLTLQPGNVNVTGQTGITVNPTTNTTYTLVATNPSGSVQRTTSVQVGAGAVINSFTVADANPLFGAETSLSWNVSGATAISINQGVGTVTATGTAPVLVYQNTTYTLSATNNFGTVTAAVTVNQPTPIGITAAGFTARRVTSNTAFPFAGKGYLESAVSLVGQTTGGPQFGSAATGTYTRLNFSDGAQGEFTSGDVTFPGGGGDNFAVRFTGTLLVNTPGEYTFLVNCDDGCRLRVDGQDVIVDDGTHTPNSSSGRITLNKPTAEIELIYYDATGGAALELGWIRPNREWQLLAPINPATPVVRGQVLISEFMADNEDTILDENGVASDWLEIWNSTNATVDLTGYFLTDDPALPNKWGFPSWTLGANKYLVAFASAFDRKPAQAVAGQDNPGTLAQPRLHTNFKLGKTGGYLALTKANGSGGFDVVTVFQNYPVQDNDVSFGSSDTEGFTGYMETPTAGQPNAVTVQGFVEDTRFVDGANPLISRVRGRYTSGFNLAILTNTTDAIIRFTTDGSEPTRTRGTIYTGPIPISSTKAVRAFAYKAGWKATNVDTQTYLFINDIVSQSSATATALGWPVSPVNGQVFRWGMNLTAVTNGGGTLQSLKDALAAAPSVCLNTDVSNFTDPASGIYVNPGKRGRFWERPASIEYINPAGTSEFQIDCGVRIRGGASRAVSNPRHAFHLYFRGSLYDGDLKYPIFGPNGASRFDQIDMRTEQNYSWAKDGSGSNTLLREEWGRVTQADMGQPNSRTGYFHLYVNGLYWGVFNWEERTEAAFGETYLGGLKDNYDTVKSAGNAAGYNTEMTDGNFAAWQDLFNQSIALKNDIGAEESRTTRFQRMRGLNLNGTRNSTYPVLLDADNLIDFMLVTFYDGSYDAPMSTFLSNASNNWFGLRDRAGQRGFSFYVHDHEHGMDAPGRQGDSYNRVGPWGGTGANNWNQNQYGTRDTFLKSNPQYLHELLCFSAEYRLRFADRAQRHLFNGGALTTEKSLARLNTLATQVDQVIHAEAARWGSGSLHRNTWLSAKSVVTTFINNGGTLPTNGQTTFPTPQQRTLLLLTQLRGYADPVGSAKALYPAAAMVPPTLGGQFGGAVTAPYQFTLTHPTTEVTVYYTLNGDDPRSPITAAAPGGGITPGALTGTKPVSVTINQTATLKARGYNTVTQQWTPLLETTFVVGAFASSANLAVSKIHYNPPGSVESEEFIEVMNIAATPIDLTNVQFDLGIQARFPDGYTLAPGGRAVVVRNIAAFKTAFPTVPDSQIAAEFLNGTTLDNGGIQLRLVASNGNFIRNFNYDDESPWPIAPDGSGPCLVLKRPETNPDHANGANWRASEVAGGTPGQSDNVSYNTWASTNGVTDPTGNLDGDGDGSSSLMEYAMGTNPSQPSLSLPTTAYQILVVDGIPNEYLTITFRRKIGRDDVTLVAESNSNLPLAWNPAVQVGNPTYPGDGTELVTYRYPQPRSTGTQQFLRVKVTKLQ